MISDCVDQKLACLPDSLLLRNREFRLEGMNDLMG